MHQKHRLKIGLWTLGKEETIRGRMKVPTDSTIIGWQVRTDIRRDRREEEEMEKAANNRRRLLGIQHVRDAQDDTKQR